MNVRVNFVGSDVDGKYFDFFQRGKAQMVLNFRVVMWIRLEFIMQHVVF
jgi:hypothetical protein